jgi:hypothetical protein
MNRNISLFSAALLTVLVSACSSKSSPSTTAKKGGGATSATSAKTSGQKAGQAALQNKAKATAKGASTGTTGKQKGAGAHSPTAAKTAGEKTTSSSKAVNDTAKAADKGASIPDTGGDVACDADHELEAFCADDTNLVFCTGGHWYSLDCSAAEGGSCGEDVSASTVDCYGAADLGAGDAIVCDASNEGVAYCEDDDRELFCTQGSWYELSCSSVAPGEYCGEDDATHVVDCGQ